MLYQNNEINKNNSMFVEKMEKIARLFQYPSFFSLFNQMSKQCQEEVLSTMSHPFPIVYEFDKAKNQIFVTIVNSGTRSDGNFIPKKGDYCVTFLYDFGLQTYSKANSFVLETTNETEEEYSQKVDDMSTNHLGNTRGYSLVNNTECYSCIEYVPLERERVLERSYNRDFRDVKDMNIDFSYNLEKEYNIKMMTNPPKKKEETLDDIIRRMGQPQPEPKVCPDILDDPIPDEERKPTLYFDKEEEMEL